MPILKETISKEKYEKATGQIPDQDDLVRVNCLNAGKTGHHFCGWCTEHNKPRFICGCFYKKPSICPKNTQNERE